MEKYHIKSNTNKRNGDSIMNNVEKPMKLAELANLWGMHIKTLKKHWKDLREKFPEEPSLNREINGRSVVYPSDIPVIKECQVRMKSIN